jgi:diguanylate cyclase (GGDEF)-like protein/PAS domain S-box-containing protein
MYPWQLDPDFNVEAWQAEWNQLKQDGSHVIESRHRHKNGTIFPVEISCHFIVHDDVECSFVFVQNITERKRTTEVFVAHEAQLRQKERHQRALLDNFPFEVWMKDKESRFLAVNQAFAQAFGFDDANQLIGKNDFDSSPPDLAEIYRADDREVMATRQKKTVEEEIEDQGVRKWVETYKAPVLDENNEILGTVGFARDITARKDAEKQMRFLAHFDQLTNLPNRTLLIDRTNQAIAKAKRKKSMLAVLYLDLDKFKPVNDKLGHNIGDLLLKAIAARLLECAKRESDTASRVGGDEFVILLSHIQEKQDAVIVAEKILHALRQPFTIESHTIYISASIGIAIYPEHAQDVEEMLKLADNAMYQAKKIGHDCYQFYQPEQ